MTRAARPSTTTLALTASSIQSHIALICNNQSEVYHHQPHPPAPGLSGPRRPLYLPPPSTDRTSVTPTHAHRDACFHRRNSMAKKLDPVTLFYFSI